MSRLARFLGFPAGKRLLSKWHRDRPDAVCVATEGPLGWSAVRTARRLGIPAATGFHTRFDEYVSHYGAGFLAPVVLAWLRRFHNRAQSTVVPTLELADFLRQRGFARVEVMRRAVDTQLFDSSRHDLRLREAWGLRSDQVAVIYLSRIAPEKNLGLAVRAFRAIQQRQPDARFVFVGDGPARAALEAANPDFIFTGVQHGATLAAHFASADLFLFPSLSETFGNVTLEAMASGVALVAYDYGAAREHVRRDIHGASIACGDEAGFVHAATALASDGRHRTSLSRAARARGRAQPGRRASQLFRTALPPGTTAGRMTMRSHPSRLHLRDASVCLACSRWGRRQHVRRFFAVVSRLGDGALWYTLMLAIVCVDGLDGLRASAHVAATGPVALLMYRWLKRWTRRPRPFAADRRIFALVRPLDGFSFPSGHTLHAVSFSVVAIAHYPALAWLVAPFTLCIAASRVVLGLHYPSDVLAATGIGLVLASLSLWIAPGAAGFSG